MRRALFAVKAVWILAVVAALAFHLYSVSFTSVTDSHVVLGWAMIALTFPLGLLPMMVYGFIVQVSHGAANDAVLWFIMALVGYFQWFWLIPRIVEWGKSQFSSSR